MHRSPKLSKWLTPHQECKFPWLPTTEFQHSSAALQLSTQIISGPSSTPSQGPDWGANACPETLSKFWVWSSIKGPLAWQARQHDITLGRAIWGPKLPWNDGILSLEYSFAPVLLLSATKSWSAAISEHTPTPQCSSLSRTYWGWSEGVRGRLGLLPGPHLRLISGEPPEPWSPRAPTTRRVGTSSTWTPTKMLKSDPLTRSQFPLRVHLISLMGIDALMGMDVNTVENAMKVWGPDLEFSRARYRE